MKRVKRGVFTTLNIGKIRKIWYRKDTENPVKERENSKNLVNDFKKSSEIFAVKMEIFSRK